MKYEEQEDKKSEVNEPDLAGYYNAADYLKWTFDGLVELIRGKIRKMSSPASAHQRISAKMSYHFYRFFDTQPCTVWVAPYDVYLIKDGEHYREARNIVQPDICVVCDRNKIKRLGCVGAPDMVIEILSQSNPKNDMDYKYTLYEEYGVREYWIVRPADGTITIHVLQNGRYVQAATKARGQQLRGVLFPELVVDLETVFEDIEFDD